MWRDRWVVSTGVSEAPAAPVSKKKKKKKIYIIDSSETLIPSAKMYVVMHHKPVILI